MEWLLISIGGGIGATLRFSVQQLINYFRYSTYWATAVVNIIGSFFLGLAGKWAIESPMMMSFFTIGVLGAFTTFSTFSFDIVKLIENKKWITLFWFLFINLGGGLCLYWLGWIID